jgi:hypothetical protein
VLSLPSGRRVLLLDALVALWALMWILVGVLVAATVVQLTELTGAFRAVGGAVTGLGDTLGGIDVPIIGGPLEGASEAVRDAGRGVTARGEAVRGDIERTSVVLGAAVALGPILLVLLAYGPVRAVRAREARALRRLLDDGAGEPEFEALLAQRALTSLSFRRLRRVSARPWEDDLTTRRALAEEELRRLGVSRSRLGRERLREPGRGPAP